MTEQRPFGELLAVPLRSGVTVAAADRGAGLKMLNMGELFRYPRIPDVDMARVDLGIADIQRTMLEPGDLMFARRSLTLEGAGKCSLVCEISEPTTWEGSIIRARLDRAVAHPPYYFYFFRSPAGRRLMETIVEQVAAAGIRLSELRTLRVPVPDMNHQTGVADVLEALDDKIAANTTLAATANELTVALVAGAGVPAAKLSGLVKHHKRPISPDAMGCESVWHHSLPAFDSRGIPEHESPQSIKSAKFAIDRPCVLVSKLNPRFPRIWDVATLRQGIMVASTEFLVLEPTFSTSTVLWAVLSQPEVSTTLESKVAGTSGSHQRVRPDDLLSVEVADVRALDGATQERITTLGERAARSLDESQTLATLRDALLPQLMSGKVRVKDAEQLVEDVV